MNEGYRSGDAVLEAGLAAPADQRWNDFFGWDIAKDDTSGDEPCFNRWYELAYDLGVVQDYQWGDWVESAGRRYFASRDLSVSGHSNVTFVW